MSAWPKNTNVAFDSLSTEANKLVAIIKNRGEIGSLVQRTATKSLSSSLRTENKMEAMWKKTFKVYFQCTSSAPEPLSICTWNWFCS